MAQYDAQLDEIQSRIDGIETGLDILEAKGNFASKQYFDMLIKAEQDNIGKLATQYAEAEKAMNDALQSGAVDIDSEAYLDMQQSVREIGSAWQEAKLSLIEYQNQMREMDWSIFEKQQEYIGNLTGESDFIRELLALNEADLFNKDTGQLSDKGQAIGGLHAVDYNIYMAQGDDYAKKIKELNKELEKDPTNTILLDKKQEYLEAQRESIIAAKDEKDAVKDLISDSYDKMLDILQKLIDKRKEALNAEKDLYDYEQSIKEQTSNIKNLKKQLSSVEGDDSEEGMSKKQQLQDQLKTAEEDLQNSEYDQWLSDSEKMLDTLVDEYQTILNARLDDIDKLMTEMINSTNNNSNKINETINSATNNVGYTLTEGMKNIWKDTGGGIGKVVTDYSTNFTTLTTTTNNYLKSIYDLINKNVKNADKAAGDNTNTKPPTSSGGGGSSSTSKPSGGSGGGSSSSGGSNKGSFFRYKYDGYPKHLLNINTSIIDRMKYRNYDTSWSAMQAAYAGMGLGSASSYYGTYQQNVNMLNWINF